MPDASGRASYLAYRAGAEIARALPPALALPIARAASRGMTRVWRGRHDEVERNVRRVLGSAASEQAVRDTTAEVFANYARYWQEMFRLSRERPDSFDARVDESFSVWRLGRLTFLRLLPFQPLRPQPLLPVPSRLRRKRPHSRHPH